MTEFEVINRVVDVDGTKKMIRGVWLTTIFLVIYFALLGVENMCHSTSCFMLIKEKYETDTHIFIFF